MHRFGTGEEARTCCADRIRPFLLRRLKGDVLRELPEKVEITPARADMTEEQRRVYQAQPAPPAPAGRRHVGRQQPHRDARRALPSCGRSAAIRRWFCPATRRPAASSIVLLDVLARLAGQRVIARCIFSQFTAHAQNFASADMEARGHLLTMYLDGETPAETARWRLVQQLQRGRRSAYSSISLKAGGSRT